jgi:hypothetical protein
MEVEWVFIDEDKPKENGFYLVLWASPYSLEMQRGGSYFNSDLGRFNDSPAGANEILFWLSGVEDIDLPQKGLRTRRTKK